MTLLEGLQLAAERSAGRDLAHVDAVPVVEAFRGITVWHGVVEVFAPKGETEPCAYAWAVMDAPEPRYVAVQRRWPLKTPSAAVRAWIESQAKK